MDGLRADIRKNMERELSTRVENQVKSQVMDGLVESKPYRCSKFAGFRRNSASAGTTYATNASRIRFFYAG